MATIRVALANTPFPSTRQESLEIVLETMNAASSGAAAIICFPECFVPGCIVAERWRRKVRYFDRLRFTITELFMLVAVCALNFALWRTLIGSG